MPNKNKIAKNFKYDLNDICLATKIVYSNKKYYLITLVAATLVYVILSLAINLEFLTSPIFLKQEIFRKLIIIFSLLEEVFIKNHLHTTIPNIIIGILAGINISFMHYKYKLNKSINKKEGIVGTIGAIFGLLAGGCASCSLSILTVFGVVGGLSFLPFEGLEVTILGIILLIVSIFWASRSVIGVCKIKGIL